MIHLRNDTNRLISYVFRRRASSKVLCIASTQVSSHNLSKQADGGHGVEEKRQPRGVKVPRTPYGWSNKQRSTLSEWHGQDDLLASYRRDVLGSSLVS